MARSFNDRVDYARRALLEGRNRDNRLFDHCFEMYDGALVVTALMRQAVRCEPRLMAAIERSLTADGLAQWTATAKSYRHLVSDDALAREAAAIRAAERQRFEREQSLWLSKQPATEPTQAGLQYVMPGCEKDRTRGPSQLDLF